MAAIGAPRLAGIVPPGGVLAIELDPARPANRLFVLSVVAGLHPRRGRAGLLAHRRFVMDPLTKRVGSALRPFRPRLVAV